MHARKLIVITILTLAFAPTFSMAKSEDETSLWKIQKTLASKKYVDLTHAFAPGIPRWQGFPDETRKTIYWHDKRPDTLGRVFFGANDPAARRCRRTRRSREKSGLHAVA